jgi:SNF2 family DNA or RNA helicase
LITRDTIEENILSLHTEKRALAEAVLEGTASAAELNVDQLLELLGPAPSLQNE